MTGETGHGMNISDLTREQLEKAYRDMDFRLQGYRWLEEEIEKFDKYIKWLKSEEDGLWIYGGRGHVEAMMTAIGHFRHQRDAAYRVLGSLIEHCVISLRAIHMIAKSSYGMTHRQRNARLDVLCDTIAEAISNLSEDKDRSPEYFTDEPFSRKDWDFRHMAGENRRMAQEIQDLKKELTELKTASGCEEGDEEELEF